MSVPIDPQVKFNEQFIYHLGYTFWPLFFAAASADRFSTEQWRMQRATICVSARLRRWPRSGPTRRRAPCWNSGPSRMKTTLPAAPRFRRWPRSGPTRRRAPCSPRGRPRTPHPDVRSAAIQALAEKWPDEATRALLATWTTEAPHPDVRSAAIQALAEKWPDEATRALLAQRAVQDENGAPRRAAIQALAAKWPDEATRTLLEQRAVQDPDRQVRGAVFPRWARCTLSLAASCRRETWMALGRISIRCNRFHAITSDRQPKRPTSVPTTSTPKSRRSRPTWDGTSPAARSHPVKTRSEENVPERGANSTSERAKTNLVLPALGGEPVVGNWQGAGMSTNPNSKRFR